MSVAGLRPRAATQPRAESAVSLRVALRRPAAALSRLLDAQASRIAGCLTDWPPEGNRAVPYNR